MPLIWRMSRAALITFLAASVVIRFKEVRIRDTRILFFIQGGFFYGSKIKKGIE